MLLPLLIATCTLNSIYLTLDSISITNIKILLFCFLEVNTDIYTDNSGSSDLSICQERKRSFHSCILCFDMRVLVPIIQKGTKKNRLGQEYCATWSAVNPRIQAWQLASNAIAVVSVWWHFPEFRSSCSDQIMLCILRRLWYSAIVLHIIQTVQLSYFSMNTPVRVHKGLQAMRP